MNWVTGNKKKKFTPKRRLKKKKKQHCLNKESKGYENLKDLKKPTIVKSSFKKELLENALFRH